MISRYADRFRAALFIFIFLEFLILAGFFIPLFFTQERQNKPRITIDLPLVVADKIRQVVEVTDIRNITPDEILVKFKQDDSRTNSSMENDDVYKSPDQTDDTITQNQNAENAISVDASASADASVSAVVSAENNGEGENPVSGSETVDAIARSGEGFVAKTESIGYEEEFTSTETYADYYQQIIRKISNTLIYPVSARKRKIRGKVIVRCEIDRQGGCTEIKVMESSGHAALDKAAVECINRVFPYAHGSGHLFRMIIPVSFVLE